MHLRCTLIAAAALTATASIASAATLTFDDYFNGPTYTEAGMTISAVGGSPNVAVNESDSFSGSNPGGERCCVLGYIDGPGVGRPISWEFTTGNRFNFKSIDVVHFDDYDPVTFFGYRDFDLVAATTLGLPDGPDRFADFVDLDRVLLTIAGVMIGDAQFDNLVYTNVGDDGGDSISPVPLPASLPLLGAVLAGLVLIGRRRSI